MKKYRYVFSYAVPDDWDEIVERNEGFILHTSKWANIFEKLTIGRGRYLQLFENNNLVCQLLVIDEIIGGAILLEYFSPFILKLLQKISFLCTFKFHMAPLFTDKKISDNLKTKYCMMLITYILNVAKKEGKNVGPANFILFKDKKYANLILHKMPLHVEKRLVATTRLRIEKNKDEMFKTIEYSRRKNIKRGEKIGVTIQQTGLEKMESYWENLKKSWAQYHLNIPSLKYYLSFPKQYTKLFFAFDKKMLLGGNGVFVFGKTAIEFSIFITDYEKKVKTRGGDLIKWEIINYCLDNNITLWDLNMIDLAESEEKTKRINFYKLEWNGDILYGIEISQLNNTLKIARALKRKILGR